MNHDNTPDKNMERLDILLETVFAHSGPPVPLGFASRIMANIESRQAKPTLAEMLAAVWRPLVVSGWAAAALLAVTLAMGSGGSGVTGLDWLVGGDSLLNYFTL